MELINCSRFRANQALILLIVLLGFAQCYTVSEFGLCVTKKCGQIACWKATVPATCTSLTEAYETCLSTSETCQKFATTWLTLKKQTSADMISYTPCYDECNSNFQGDDYLGYYYKCYSQCSDNVHSTIISPFISTLLLISALILLL